jgi:acyl-CoA synthetase (NDP forming)/GNAT superfamily N-acetyltransferase
MARVILRDGRVAELRRAQKTPYDHALVKALFDRASADSLYHRFFHMVKEVSPAVIDQMLGGNGRDQLSLICLAGDRALGIGTYSRVDEDTAEVAFLVDDELHGHGLGTLLLEHLAEEAWHYGFKRFEAHVLEDNYKMLHVFRSSGYELRQTSHSGSVRLVLPLARTERSRALQATRDKLATAASLHPFFAPRTLAVIGASRDPRGLGQFVFRNILNSGFKGTVYPVNPSAKTVASVRAYPTLLDLPEPVDLAVIVVPASQVLEVVDQCVEAKTGGVVILSAGFAEKGPAGAELQEEIVRRLRAAGQRLIGPNSLGVINTHPDVQLNASFVRQMPTVQGMSIASQSGALGIAILEYANRIGVGVTHFVSMGNKADVSSNDLIQYWEDDPATKLIALYIESFGNPRKFSQLARRITRKKPILAVKGAQSQQTRALSELPATPPSSASEEVVDALFQQTGVIRIDTLQEMFDVAALLTAGPLPQGRRVAIVTNSAGGAVLTADALLKEGLTFVHPVVDLGFDALAEGYRQVLPQVLRDETVDAVVVLFIPVGVSDQEAVVEAIAAAIEEVDDTTDNPKPVVANLLATEDYLVRFIETKSRRIPVYPFPEQAVRALAKVTAYADYLAREPGRIPDLERADSDRARAIVRAHLSEGGLPPSAARDVLEAMGISAPTSEAVEMAHLTVRVDVQLDPLFGPVLRASRLVHSSAGAERVPFQYVLRITPLTDRDAAEAAQVVSSWTEGGEACQAAVADLLLRLSRLVEDVPEISGLSLTFGVAEGGPYLVEQVSIDIADIVDGEG